MNQRITKSQVKWVRQLQQKKCRDAEGVFVAEGEKCVNDLKEAFELLLLVTPDNATQMEIIKYDQRNKKQVKPENKTN